ncbi:uncharacterized protein EI90DRAFT_3145192 [Cantharellus anzutake]|uniref:uncharacterized protein n=1 Tax=Cantharellus anzutake TaxID=1750568 RepID=UPI001906560C|nr:uncharacterized protein EI90DRAFT_3145192 [Cantharellus anzutake]KAF8333500.1 hypothetical protein EI90DRAFT_3145192 [Cantharellus anzutake]
MILIFKIQDVYKRIQTERKLIQASENLRRATGNQDVLRRTDAAIRESQRQLTYFEQTLRELQARKNETLRASTPSGLRPGDSPGALHPGTPSGVPNSPRPSDRERALPPPPPTFGDDYGPTNYPPNTSLANSPRPKQYNNLDLIKADTPYTTAKITKMLQQLEFKLQVELQYKKAIIQMAKLYQADGDKKSRADADIKRIESEKKIQLLQTALKRYRNLHILDDPQAEEEMSPADGDRKDNLRKPLSGKFYVTVNSARELDHSPLLKRSSKVYNETTVVIKVEGTSRATSRPSRTDRWNEDFEITVDKASEVEIAIYDKQPGDQPTPIGLFWLRLNDIVDALRRQRVGNESQGAWVTAAGAMQGSGGPAPPENPGASGDMNSPLNLVSVPAGGGPSSTGGAQEGVAAWFAVEPAGALNLYVNFVKENVKRRPDAGGLGRQGAVRVRKGQVHEMNGHKFVQRSFYQLMRCALCGDFLLKASGYQCEDCRYTCHRECYPKAVTKCISKSNAETEADEDKINHRIPHRFETMTNMSANWCCHCGYMLPLGRKDAKKCSECDITCHASCAHLVPDFCGMSMETANILLSQIHDIKSHQKQVKQQQRPPKAQPIPPAPQPPPLETVVNDFNRVDISSGRSSMEAPPYQEPRDPRYGSPHSPQGGLPPLPPTPKAVQAQPYPDPRIDPRTAGYPGPPLALPRRSEEKPPDPVFRTDIYPSPGRQYSTGLGTPTSVAPPSPIRHKRRKVGLDDFNFLAVLGKGNFGKVMLAEEKRSNNLYAIKVLKKEFIIDNDEVESTQSEKRVFLTAARERHPFLLGLHSCFQTETRIYFVMEYVSGGDLMLHIQRRQFSLRQAKFYAAEVLLALEYFHANDIIYRDLKLDNILLTLDGHVKVADYGLCKESMGYGQTTSTFCGTPEFMAPEATVDWWAFGVLMYEMLLGQSPFRGDDEEEIFDAILEDEPLYPITMPRDAVSILQKLLTRDAGRRLGSGPDDAEPIKRHPFFKDTNFDDVLHKRIPPPYFPTIANPSDVSNFDTEFTREQPTLTPVHGQLSTADQAQFHGFSWVAAWADN